MKGPLSCTTGALRQRSRPPFGSTLVTAAVESQPQPVHRGREGVRHRLEAQVQAKAGYSVKQLVSIGKHTEPLGEDNTMTTNAWLLLVATVALVMCGVFTAAVAGSKGYDKASWFLGGLLFGIIALLAAVGMQPCQMVWLPESEEWTCARCGKHWKEQGDCPNCGNKPRFSQREET